MKKFNNKIENYFLSILYKEFSETGLLDNIYKIAICEYKDGTNACVLIANQKKDYPRTMTKYNLIDFKGSTGITLGILAKCFNFTHIIMEPTLFWTSRRRGCNNWKYIK